MKKCSQCGFVTDNDNAKFCKRCGSPLSGSTYSSISTTDNSEKVTQPASTITTNNCPTPKRGTIHSPTLEDLDPTPDDHHNTSKWLKKHTKIHGWLSFFIFIIICGGIVSVVYPIATYDSDDYLNSWLAIGDIVSGVLLAGVAAYSVCALVLRKPNALFYCRLYLLLVLIVNACLLYIGAVDDGFQSSTRLAGSVLWSVIWLFYLAFSSQVKNVIPKPFRRIRATDMFIALAVFFIPAICFAIGLGEYNDKANEQKINESEMWNRSLDDDERTDGRIIFTIPSGFECDRRNVDISEDYSIVVYDISNDTIGNGTIASDYDNDSSIKSFQAYWDAWQNEEYSIVSYVDEGSMTINGSLCRYKTVAYDVDGTMVYWSFSVLFDKITGKSCVLSFNSLDPDCIYVDKLLRSVCFE